MPLWHDRVMPASVPLRKRQAQFNREVILDAVVDLIETSDFDDISIPAVAQASGISLRTIYRYFPSREDLLAEAGVHIRECMGLTIDINCANDIPASFWANSGRVARYPRLARALLQSRAGRAARQGSRPERVVAIEAALKELTADLAPARAQQVVAVITHLCSSSAWITISDECGLSSTDARQSVIWALQTLISELRNEVQPDSHKKLQRKEKSMTQSMTCPPCGHVVTADTEDELVSGVIEHAQSAHSHELSSEHILAELRGEAPEDVHNRIGI